MVERGARHLVLTARHDPGEDALGSIGQLEQFGARVKVAQADASDAEQMAGLLTDFEQSFPPLCGVIHAAGVLDDGVLRQQSWSRFEHVMAPKVTGSWNLHTLTRDRNLDFFVLFSSTASLLGSAGQANHAAANAFLDALAWHRRTRGLPALSINWGAWARVGVAAERKVDEHARPKGIAMVEPDEGLEMLGRLLAEHPAQVAVAPVDWSRAGEQFASMKLLADLVQDAERSSVSEPALLARLRAAPASDRRELLVAHVRSEAAKVLGVRPLEQIDPDEGFFELGMDSLTSVELRNRLQASLDCSLPTTLAFDYPTVEAIVGYVTREVAPAVSRLAPEREETRRAPPSEALDELSSDEVQRLLAEELAEIEESRS